MNWEMFSAASIDRFPELIFVEIPAFLEMLTREDIFSRARSRWNRFSDAKRSGSPLQISESGKGIPGDVPANFLSFLFRVFLERCNSTTSDQFSPSRRPAPKKLRVINESSLLEVTTDSEVSNSLNFSYIRCSPEQFKAKGAHATARFVGEIFSAGERESRRRFEMLHIRTAA